MISKYEPGQTPIDAAEAEALIPPLTTQAELNEWEVQNIIGARRWAFSKRVLNEAEPLSEKFLFELHRRMFDGTWKGAGEIRARDKNIGVPFHRIRVCLRELLNDARYWRDNTTYSFDEFAMRFHHRLVQIHLFPNGNGRHAGLAADVIGRKSGQPDFTWGFHVIPGTSQCVPPSQSPLSSLTGQSCASIARRITRSVTNF
ncbi:MAG TPA: mobile mystery protein B [Chthoniobacterales bacterium]